MLETLNAEKFQPLTKEQLKNVAGGGDPIKGECPPPEGSKFRLFVYKGENYFVANDKWSKDPDTGEYLSLQLQDPKDGTWITIV